MLCLRSYVFVCVYVCGTGSAGAGLRDRPASGAGSARAGLRDRPFFPQQAGPACEMQDQTIETICFASM